jgi:energy-coupling factor transporter ATP-binding protein EcfA2
MKRGVECIEYQAGTQQRRVRVQIERSSSANEVSMELILEDIRCFAGKHTIAIRPLTILVGENSSGKSTFLAALSAVCDPVGFPMQPSFNEPPYSLGGFDTIATYKGGRAGRRPFFSLGYTENPDDENNASTVLANYWGFEGRVVLWSLKITTPRGRLSLTLKTPFQGYKVGLELPAYGKTEAIDFVIDRTRIEGRNLDFLREISYYVNDWASKKPIETHVAADAILSISSFVSSSRPFGSPLSIAPIRTRPIRFYGEINQNSTPEGDDVPYLLARILSENSNERRPLVSALETFGKESGLFKEIAVKRQKAGDPFRVMVTVAGRPANMLDVGYGVSQALPVVVKSVLAAKERMLLIQQPEVHLHPRAQAALGSFFVDIVANAKKRLVIETHSDYIIDRIRQEVASGKLTPEDVVFLYLEKKGIETTVFPLMLDTLGNIEGAPRTYRDFFLREEMNLLSRGE